jgi:hypothetical protein
VTNDSSVNVINVVITDTVPAEGNYIGDGTSGGNVIGWTIADLNTDEMITSPP